MYITRQTILCMYNSLSNGLLPSLPPSLPAGSHKREDSKKSQGGKGKAPAAEEPSRPDDFPPENVSTESRLRAILEFKS